MAKQIFDHNNILVVGGAGFIGSHLCEKLVKNNKVICIDNLITGKEHNIDFLLKHPNFEFVNHDINEPIDIESLPELEKFKVRWQGVQEVYYLACPASPARFDELAIEILFTSSLGLKNALEIARQYKAKFLFLSSSVVYGQAIMGEELKEDYVGAADQLGPHYPYIEGKRFSESLVESYRRRYGMDIKTVRAFTTYGPRMSLDDGRLISQFVSRALEGRELVIEGDQNARNSFCYVDDLIDGILKMMNSAENGPINLGNPNVMPIIEVAKMVISIIGSKSTIVFKERDKKKQVSHIPDISYAREALGWEPIISLETGIKKTVDYLKASKDLLGFSDGGVRTS